VDGGGKLPVWFVNRQTPKTLEDFVRIHDEFSRNDEIDELERNELAGVIAADQEVYTAEEEKHIERVQTILGSSSLKEDHFTAVESPDHNVVIRKVFAPGNPNVIGKASTVCDAPVEVCAAKELCKTSRSLTAAFKKQNGIERRVEVVNNHHVVIKTVYVPVRAKQAQKSGGVSARAKRAYISSGSGAPRPTPATDARAGRQHRPEVQLLFCCRSGQAMAGGGASPQPHMPSCSGVNELRQRRTTTDASNRRESRAPTPTRVLAAPLWQKRASEMAGGGASPRSPPAAGEVAHVRACARPHMCERAR
jgi:hypothetical protein